MKPQTVEERNCVFKTSSAGFNVWWNGYIWIANCRKGTSPKNLQYEFSPSWYSSTGFIVILHYLHYKQRHEVTRNLNYKDRKRNVLSGVNLDWPVSLGCGCYQHPADTNDRDICGNQIILYWSNSIRRLDSKILQDWFLYSNITDWLYRTESSMKRCESLS
jgi:hypothetical protein